MHAMRRADRQLNEQQTEQLLEQGEYGILATIDVEGQPYGTPLNYVKIGLCIYFHCAPEGLILCNIATNPKVCLTVVGQTKLLPEKFSTEYESVMAFGAVRLVTDRQEKGTALRALVHKYSAHFIPQGYEYIEKALAEVAVFRLDLAQVTGKARKPKPPSLSLLPSAERCTINEKEGHTDESPGIS